MSGLGATLSMPLTLATFVLGLILASRDRQGGWIVAIGVAGAFEFFSLLGMAWVILSGRTPISFCAPFALVPLATLAYCLLADRGVAATSSAA